MSQKDLEKVIGRLVSDSEWREAFFKNAEESLKEYDLTKDEISKLKAMKKDDVAKLNVQLDARISKYTNKEDCMAH